MRILVIHQNFPGQFGQFVRAWAPRPGWQVLGLGRDTAPGLPGFDRLTRYPLARDPHANQHPYLRNFESAVLHGQQVARALLVLKQQGFTPDAVLAHPGWGESLYVKDVFPDTRLVHFCEWYYSGQGADMGFDPEFPNTFDDRARVRTWNALHALNLTQCDAAVTPTQWQKSRHPDVFQPKIVVQHEGIDTQGLGPDPHASFKTPSGHVLRAGDPQQPVVTYVARNLEPYRGFHIFMRALAQLQRQHPTVHAVIVGGDEVSYGRNPIGAPNWRSKMLQEVQLDPTRTHFTGKLPRSQYIKVLQISAAHVYLTYPFVLSWSLLEAMACGATVVAGNTEPVREVITPGHNGLLVPFFEADRIARQVQDVLENADTFKPLRAQARHTVMPLSFDAGLRGYEALLSAAPAPTATLT